VTRKLNFLISVNPSSISGHCLQNSQWQGNQNSFRGAGGSLGGREAGESTTRRRAWRSSSSSSSPNILPAKYEVIPGMRVVGYLAGKGKCNDGKEDRRLLSFT